MLEFASSSVFFGVFVTLAAYFIGQKIRSKTGLSVMNPILIAVVMIIALLRLCGIDYSAYNQSAKMISSLLTPATICLAVPLYEQIELLKQHKKAIFLGVLSGVITSLVCVLAISLIFRLDHASYVTLLPKSITSAIGMGMSEELGGYPAITVAVIILTGIFGSIIAKGLLRLCAVTDPVAKGVAIGTSAHALGTTRALELGEIEGAMSGLSIVVAGVLTVIGASVFSMLM